MIHYLFVVIGGRDRRFERTGMLEEAVLGRRWQVARGGREAAVQLHALLLQPVFLYVMRCKVDANGSDS